MKVASDGQQVVHRFTRRQRDAVCHPRVRRGATRVLASQPRAGRPAFDWHLQRVIRGDTDSLQSLSALYAAHGWKPPPPALREGGMWPLDPATIAALPAPPVARPGIVYGEPWFDECFAIVSGVPQLPHIECRRPAGAPVPDSALLHIRAGMCCVLENARLWPAAEDKWGAAGYLARELQSASCSVLSSPAASRRFSYWFDASGYADRVQAGYQAQPLVTSQQMRMQAFLEASTRTARTSLLYLQQSLLQAAPDRPHAGLIPCAGLGEGMTRDIQDGIDMEALRMLAQAGGFGPWQRCQLFVGGAAAEGARSILHFDQYDNLFVQVAGTKTFRIYDPQQTRHLYAYPIHHPLDTRAQVDLKDPDDAAFPRLAEAKGVTITLGPGQLLFLPAYWWHEVLTEPHEHADVPSGSCAAAPTDQPLTVSVNFWFAATARLLAPTVPLVPSMQCELARQLEYLVSDCLADKAWHVPAFLSGLLDAINATARVGGSGGDGAYSNALLATRPPDVDELSWLGCFEFVVYKLALWVGPQSMGRFLSDLCHASRFSQLRLKQATR